MITLYTIVVVLLLFGATIFVHELGHFLVARWCGMVVDVFSIGFGPALFRRKINGVVYKIGLIPFGGYVALPQMDPGGGKAEEGPGARHLPPATPWKKLLVALSGVTGNMIFAVLLAYIVYWVGKPSAPHERSCVIGFIDTNSVVYAQGLRLGDEIVAADGEPVGSWDDLTLASALNEEVRLEVVSAAGEKKQMKARTEKNWLGIKAVPGISWVNLCSVASVIPGSSAEKAGIAAGDVVVEFNGVRLYSREHLIDLVNQARDREVMALVERNGQAVEVRVTPAYDAKLGRALIGIMFNTMDVDYDQIVHPRPGGQIKDHAMIIFRLLKAFATPREARAASQAVGGPIAIFVMLWWTVQKSLILAIWFTCMLNVNLAIINLLPIPVVDGGHVVFSLWEIVTRRRISARVVNAVANLFAVLIIGVFLLLTYRDVVRWIVPLFPHAGEESAETATNAPPAETPAK